MKRFNFFKTVSFTLNSLSVVFVISVVVFTLAFIFKSDIKDYLVKKRLTEYTLDISKSNFEELIQDKPLKKYFTDSIPQNTLDEFSNRYTNRIIANTQEYVKKSIDSVVTFSILIISILFIIVITIIFVGYFKRFIKNSEKNSISTINKLSEKIQLELQDTAIKISEIISDNLYTYVRLKEDLLEPKIVFVYGNFIYLKEPESDEFLYTALKKNYWEKESNYFIIITQKTKSNIENLFLFINKLRKGIKDIKVLENQFRNFYIGFQDSEIPSPIQMVAFFNKIGNDNYKIVDIKVESIREIKFKEGGRIKLKKINGEGPSEKTPTCKSCIGHTLVFSNDLMRQSGDSKNKIIGFKIPILDDEKHQYPYEILKEFDRVRENVTYYEFSKIYSCCEKCKRIDECCEENIESFISMLNNNYNCEYFTC